MPPSLQPPLTEINQLPLAHINGLDSALAHPHGENILRNPNKRAEPRTIHERHEREAWVDGDGVDVLLSVVHYRFHWLLLSTKAKIPTSQPQITN